MERTRAQWVDYLLDNIHQDGEVHLGKCREILEQEQIDPDEVNLIMRLVMAEKDKRAMDDAGNKNARYMFITGIIVGIAMLVITAYFLIIEGYIVLWAPACGLAGFGFAAYGNNRRFKRRF